MLYYKQNKDGLMVTFLDTYFPGAKIEDQFNQILPLFTSRDPSSVVMSMALKSMNDGCLEKFKALGNKCEQGFILDNSTGWCLKGLSQPNNFWESSEQCQTYAAQLIEFNNDVQVQGLLNLLKNGKC
jgi:hypothetical protein